MILKNGRHRHVIDIDPDEFPRQNRKLNALPHGKKTEYVMRKLHAAVEESQKTLKKLGSMAVKI